MAVARAESSYLETPSGACPSVLIQPPSLDSRPLPKKDNNLCPPAALLYILTPNDNTAARRACAEGELREVATILLADDDPTILLVAAAILSRSGYKVLTAANGNEALKAFENEKDTIHLVISDFAMPGMNGYQFVRSIQNLSPSTAVLLMSAAWPLISECGVTTIMKPFTQEALVAKVRSLLAGCDFAQIEREQSSARAQRNSAKVGKNARTQGSPAHL